MDAGQFWQFVTIAINFLGTWDRSRKSKMQIKNWVGDKANLSQSLA
jgi:hypothetical protein